LSLDSKTKLSFLYPFEQELASADALKPSPFNGLTIEKIQNNHSLVFLLEMYESRFLFTGDMEKIIENKLLAHLNNSSDPSLIDVLKVAHHGSKTSTTELWLDYWQPKQAVISVGEHNTYGHPTAEVLDRLSQHQIKVYRTDKQGEVDMTVKEDGIHTNVKLNSE
jgi:competence protein ComEC